MVGMFLQCILKAAFRKKAIFIAHGQSMENHLIIWGFYLNNQKLPCQKKRTDLSH
jgi:hypothetical protein